MGPVLSEAMQALVARALNSERGIAITFPTEGQAINWRQRYYTVRKSVVKHDPSSEWRTLTCVVANEDGKWKVKLIPNDAHILSYDIEEL